jgi:hypothetical protein
MSAPFVPALDTFTGGQMTDLPSFPGTNVDPTALFEIVSPGNPNQAVNYSITALQLGIFVAGVLYANPTFVTSGAVYNSVAADTRILVNKTVGSATSVVLLGATNYALPVLVKDLKGDAATNPITVTFSGVETLDGLSQIVINNAFGYFWFNPLMTGGWYDASA